MNKYNNILSVFHNRGIIKYLNALLGVQMFNLHKRNKIIDYNIFFEAIQKNLATQIMKQLLMIIIVFMIQ